MKVSFFLTGLGVAVALLIGSGGNGLVKPVAENGDWVARGPAEMGVDVAEVAEVGLWKTGTGGGSTRRSGDLLLTGLVVGGCAAATVCSGDNG